MPLPLSCSPLFPRGRLIVLRLAGTVPPGTLLCTEYILVLLDDINNMDAEVPCS